LLTLKKSRRFSGQCGKSMIQGLPRCDVHFVVVIILERASNPSRAHASRSVMTISPARECPTRLGIREINIVDLAIIEINQSATLERSVS
jgi:hypothetical protein